MGAGVTLKTNVGMLRTIGTLVTIYLTLALRTMKPEEREVVRRER